MARLRPLCAVLLTAFSLVLVLVACSEDADWGKPDSTLGLPPAHDDSVTTTTDAGGKLKAGDQGCNLDTDCETNLCFKGNAQSFCTVFCNTSNAQQICLPPLTGTCNKQGYCKRD